MVSSGKQRTIGEKLSAAGLTVRGKDGQDYHMRPIRPSDAASLIRGYDALSDRGKRFRMFSVIPHLSEEMAADFCSPDPESEVCVVVDGRGTLKGEILGGARLADMGPGRAALALPAKRSKRSSILAAKRDARRYGAPLPPATKPC